KSERPFDFEIVWIDADLLEEIPLNVKPMTKEEIELLKQSISELGMADPLQVVKMGERYIIINGNHRYRILKNDLGWNKMPCVIIGENWEYERILAEAIRLNKLMGKFDPVEFYKALDKIFKKWGKTMDEDQLRRKLGITRRDALFKKAFDRITGRTRSPSTKTIVSAHKALVKIIKKLAEDKKVGIVTEGENFVLIKLSPEVFDDVREVMAEVYSYGMDVDDVFEDFVKFWRKNVEESGLNE
ncbi:hypothetical protein DRN93_04330, partial [archaeon]